MGNRLHKFSPKRTFLFCIHLLH